MSKTAHTRGPWKAIGLSIHSDRKDGSPETWVAEVKQGRADAVKLADARLIAAAPDLLESLSDMLSFSEGWDVTRLREWFDTPAVDAILKARAAIARAKGGA